MTDGTMFNNETQAPVEPTPTPQTEGMDFSSALQAITNEDGGQKYSDVNAALSSIAPAQSHIKTIEEENATLKEELSKRQTAEDLLAQFQNKPEPTSSQPPSVTTEQISNLVKQAIDGNESNKVTTANQATVIKALTDKFGDKAEEQYLAAGAKFGLGPQTLDELSGKSPDAVLSWFPEVATPASHTSGGMNTDSFQNTPTADVNMAVLKKGASPCTTNDGVAAWREAGKLIKSN